MDAFTSFTLFHLPPNVSETGLVTEIAPHLVTHALIFSAARKESTEEDFLMLKLIEMDNAVTLQQQMTTEAAPVILINQFKVKPEESAATGPFKTRECPPSPFYFIFLYMAAKGAGEWSLVELIRRKRGHVVKE